MTEEMKEKIQDHFAKMREINKQGLELTAAIAKTNLSLVLLISNSSAKVPLQLGNVEPEKQIFKFLELLDGQKGNSGISKTD